MANLVAPLLLMGGGGALVWQGSRMKGAPGHAVVAAGAALVGAGLGSSDGLAREAARLSLERAPTNAVTLRRQVTIGRHRHQVWKFWRDPQRMRALMPQVENIEILETGNWRWTARIPGGALVQWISGVDEERANKHVTWHADEPFCHCGLVEFRDAPGWRGTEVLVTLSWQAPFGKLGGKVVSWLGHDPGTELAAMLRRMKQMLEAGAVVTVAGQTHGARPAWWSERE